MRRVDDIAAGWPACHKEQTYDVVVIGAGRPVRTSPTRRPGRAERRARRERAGRRRVLVLGVHAEQGAAARHRGARRGARRRRRGAGGQRRAGRRRDPRPARRVRPHWDDAGQVQVGRRRRHRTGPRHGRLGRRAQGRGRPADGSETAADRPARGRGVHRHGGRRPAGRRAGATSTPWTPREATSAKEAPGRLLSAAAYVGREMATAWQALGSR